MSPWFDRASDDQRMRVIEGIFIGAGGGSLPLLQKSGIDEAKGFGGGQAASKTLRHAGFLACGIGLPIDPVEGDMNGLRFGTPELVRWGMTAEDAPQLAGLIAQALRANDPAAIAGEVADWRQSFDRMHFVN